MPWALIMCWQNEQVVAYIKLRASSAGCENRPEWAPPSSWCSGEALSCWESANNRPALLPSLGGSMMKGTLAIRSHPQFVYLRQRVYNEPCGRILIVHSHSHLLKLFPNAYIFLFYQLRFECEKFLLIFWGLFFHFRCLYRV